jgi:hypothetical protein
MDNQLIPRQVPIVGPPHLVRATLETQLRQGRLLTHPSDITLARNPDGTVTVMATILVEQELPWRKRHPVLTTAMVVGVVLGVLFGALALIAHLVVAAAHTANGAAAFCVLAFIGLALLAGWARRDRADACPGVTVHCRNHKH